MERPLYTAGSCFEPVNTTGRLFTGCTGLFSLRLFVILPVTDSLSSRSVSVGMLMETGGIVTA